MSRYSTTEYNRIERLRATVTDIFSSARLFKSPHALIMDKVDQRVYQSPDWKRAPGWTRSAISERISMSYASLYGDALAWGFLQDGCAVEWEQLREENLEQIRLVKVAGFHYYRGTESDPRKY